MFGYWLAGQKMFGHVLFGHVLSFNHPCFEPHFDLCQFKPTKHMVSVTPGRHSQAIFLG
jgi:hypothetical protein